MFDLPDSYVWDFWLADDGQAYHLFFLHAPKSLNDPEARHTNASIGHATSTDLVNWTRVTDALSAGASPGFDDQATWTGCVVRQGGLWYMFYTGLTMRPQGGIQSVGYATSPDLTTWTRGPGEVAGADPRWYEQLGGAWHDQAFRDPWVTRDAEGHWHMIVTARSAEGDPDNRGVVGYATSPDLHSWTTQPPLTKPGRGFGQMEVMQTWQIDGHWVLLFSVFDGQLAANNPNKGTTAGAIWLAHAEGPLGPFDLENAYPILERDHYVGRLINDRDSGRTVLLAFRNEDADGNFVGGVIDPIPLKWDDVLNTVSLDV